MRRKPTPKNKSMDMNKNFQTGDKKQPGVLQNAHDTRAVA